MADRHTYRRWILIGLAFLWMAFVYASFYLVKQQRPLSETNLLAIGSALLDLVAAGCMLCVAALAGNQVCRWLGVRFDHPSEALVWGTGIGLGTIGVGVLCAGLFGWLTRWAVLALLGVLVLVSLPSLRDLYGAISGLRSAVRPGRALAVYAGAMLVLTLLVALLPPLSWDGLFYHLTFPRLYIEQGRIAPVTDVPHQYFPGLMEMLYLGAMLLKGDTAAKLLHLAYLALLGGGVYLIAQRHLQKGHGWAAVTAYVSMPMVFVLGSWAYNDLALSFYQLAALYVLLNWSRDQRWHWLALCGAFCGLAMGLKYTSVFGPMTIVLLTCWRLFEARASLKTWVRTVALFSLVALVVAAPWYARNLFCTGNPVYPFAYGLFGGSGWDAWRGAWYARAGSGLGWDVPELLKLPWMLTLGLRDMNFYDGRMGPLFLLALPFLLAWLARLFGRPGPRPPAIGYLLVFALIQFASWVAGVMGSRALFQTRLLLPAFVALCPVLAYVFDELRTLDTPMLSVRRLVGMSVVLVLAANLCYHFLDVVDANPLPVLVGQESRDSFLTRRLGAHYRAMQVVDEHVPRDGRALFMWEPRSYYSHRSVQPDAILERWAWLLHRHDGDVDAIAAELGADGYTHVLLFRAGLERVQDIGFDPIGEAEAGALEALIRAYCKEEARAGDAYVLYRFSVNEGTVGE